MTERGRYRYCRACSARLATDNQSDLCGACARRTAGRTDAPPQVADNFWDRPAIRTALQRRQFGKVLAAYRRSHDTEVTQADLGTWLGLTQGQVSRIERLVTPTKDLVKLERWARTLGIPESHLWFRFSTQSPHTFDSDSGGPSMPATSDVEGDDLHRRQFLRTVSSGAAIVGSTLLASTKSAYQATPNSASDILGHPDVETVRQTTNVFRRLDNRYGGGYSRSDVTAFLTSSVEPKLRHGRANSEIRNDLFSAAAELYQLAGWMAYDTGQAEAGRAHLRHALRLSQEAGNDALSAEMFAGMSHQAAFYGAPDDAIDLALAARQLSDRTGLAALKAEAAVMEAHGFALQGDKKASISALRNAEQSFARVSRDDGPAWLGYFDDAYMAAKFAHTFRDLGQPKEAEMFARRSLSMNDGYERGRLFNTVLLASTLADQRRVDEACTIGTDAVAMAQSVRSVRSAAYLADLARRLEPFRKELEVRSLFGQLESAGIPTPSA